LAPSWLVTLTVYRIVPADRLGLYQKYSHDASRNTISDETTINRMGMSPAGIEMCRSDSIIPTDVPAHMVIIRTSGSEIEIPEVIKPSMFSSLYRYLNLQSVFL
jgi:hypothetical protein